MKITANIRADEKAMMDPNVSQVASGWVELEDFIKFPVRVRKYTDKKDNKEKMFVSYPQRKTDQGYVPVISPDRETKQEIETCVLEELHRQIVKGLNTPPITDVDIVLADKKWNVSDNVKAVASIKIAGVNVHGVMIKEGRNGLFVQMPRHRADGEYKDTVYGTSGFAQNTIKRAILQAYDDKISQKEPQPSEVTEESVLLETENPNIQLDQENNLKDSIAGLIDDYEQNNIEKMISDLHHVSFVPEKPLFAKGSNLLARQSAYLRSPDSADYIEANFYNTYSDDQPFSETGCGVEITIGKDGKYSGRVDICYRESQSAEEAEKNYQEILAIWEQMIAEKTVPEKRAHLDETEGRELLLAAYDAGDEEGMRAVLKSAGSSPQLTALYRELTGERTPARKTAESSPRL